MKKTKLQESLDIIEKLDPKHLFHTMGSDHTVEPPAQVGEYAHWTDNLSKPPAQSTDLKTIAHEMYLMVAQHLDPDILMGEETEWCEAYILGKLEQVAEDNQTHEM